MGLCTGICTGLWPLDSLLIRAAADDGRSCASLTRPEFVRLVDLERGKVSEGLNRGGSMVLTVAAPALSGDKIGGCEALDARWREKSLRVRAVVMAREGSRDQNNGRKTEVKVMRTQRKAETGQCGSVRAGQDCLGGGLGDLGRK
jgi:hypothetical protein